MTNQQKVEQFMRAAGEPVQASPGHPSIQERELRINLITEELQELRSTHSLVMIADAIADLLYVVYGTAAAYGFDAQKLFDEAHRSNMTKFIDGHKREDGKWIKGPSYSPADFKQFCP